MEHLGCEVPRYLQLSLARKRGDTQSVGEGGAGDLRGSCLEGTQISKLFKLDALRTSVDDDNEHAYLSNPFVTT